MIGIQKSTIFREEATSALAGVHAGPTFRIGIWRCLVFVEEVKLENPEKNPRSKARWPHG